MRLKLIGAVTSQLSETGSMSKLVKDMTKRCNAARSIEHLGINDRHATSNCPAHRQSGGHHRHRTRGPANRIEAHISSSSWCPLRSISIDYTFIGYRGLTQNLRRGFNDGLPHAGF